MSTNTEGFVEALPQKREDAEMYLKVLRAAARHRDGKGRHFCHNSTFRHAFVRRIVQLRKALRDGTY